MLTIYLKRNKILLRHHTTIVDAPYHFNYTFITLIRHHTTFIFINNQNQLNCLNLKRRKRHEK